MESSGIHQVIPYIVNFSVVVVILVVATKKPLRAFVYQRHERIKDSVESAKIAFDKAEARKNAAEKIRAQIGQEEKRLLTEELARAEELKKEILTKGQLEAKRVALESQRLGQVEREEAERGMRKKFLELVVSESESAIKKGLKKDDHTAIIARVQNSIEVGV